jgi:hypothetical protein
MRISHLPIVAALLAVFLMATGCRKQADANTELANAVQALEKAEPTPPPAAVAPAPVAAPAAAPAPVNQEAVIRQPVAQQMSQAMASYKGGDYVDAVTRLQWLRAKVTKTPEQTMAVQDAMASVMAELYDRAAKGDTRADQAIKQYQADRNKR